MINAFTAAAGTDVITIPIPTLGSLAHQRVELDGSDPPTDVDTSAPDPVLYV